MPLKIYIRHYQIYNKEKQPIIYVGANPANLSVQLGTVPQSDWIDVTELASGLNKLRISWEIRDNHRINTGITGQFILFDAAYKFVKGWVNDHVAAPLNAVEVRIEDVGCVNYTDFVIKADGIQFCDDETCQVEVTAKQADEVFNCIQTTRIADDHLGWFNKHTTKKHPRFTYCDKISGFLLGVIFSTLALVVFMIMIITPVVVVVCNIVKLFGDTNCPDSFKGIEKSIEALYQKAAGCGRQHPAPLVRDYIFNVCKKCGVDVTAATAPIFFDPNSDYYNTTYLNPESKKGLVSKNDKILQGQSGYWIEENEPLLTLDMFLDKLAVPYNSEWRIINNQLYFNKKNEMMPKEVLFDFTEADKDELISNICYEWNGDKKPAFLRGVYQKDAVDATGNEAAERMNDIVEFNDPINPMLEGEKTIMGEFGMQRFMWDGGDQPYISNAMEFARNTLIGVPVALVGLNVGKQAFLDLKGVLYMTGDTCLFPKLLVWDGVDYDNAKVVRPYSYENDGAYYPPPNIKYNKEGKNYEEVHPQDYDNFYDLDGVLYNYPMFFDAQFKGNLYDRFFDIEDPRTGSLLNKTWDLQIRNCCDNLRRLGVDGNGSNVAIGRRVRLFKDGYYTEGIIESIEVNYDVTDRNGKFIRLRGKI